MGDYLIGVGVVLAVLGPLLLIPAIWLVYRVVALPLLKSTPLALAASLGLVLGSLAVSYAAGRVQYGRMCAVRGTPRIDDRVLADGFFRTRVYPHEARAFLSEGGFSYVEGPRLGQEDVFVRYTLAEDGSVLETEVQELISDYTVRETMSTTRLRTQIVEKVVLERASGRELARAANLTYMGGPLSIFLGVWGMASCPDIRDERGSEDFTTFYDLERLVLRHSAPGT